MLQSNVIAAADNRWSAKNLLAYVNPEFDSRYREYSNALELGARRSLYADVQRWMAAGRRLRGGRGVEEGNGESHGRGCSNRVCHERPPEILVFGIR